MREAHSPRKKLRMVVRISDVPAPGSRERAPAHLGKYEGGLDRVEERARPVLKCARVAPARLHTRGGALLGRSRERFEAVGQLVGKGSRLRVPSGCSGPHKGRAARGSSHDGREPALGGIVWRIRELVCVDQGSGDHRVRRGGAVVRVLVLRNGHSVTLYDAQGQREGASYGNAGTFANNALRQWKSLKTLGGNGV